MRPAAVHAVNASYAQAPWTSCLDLQPAQRPTVARLVRDLPAGRYIVQVKGHVFAVVDGICLDVFPDARPRLRVEGFWTMAADAAHRAACKSPSAQPRDDTGRPPPPPELPAQAGSHQPHFAIN
jgi:hypothetical protein